ncbi:MAG: hypothetical protein AAFY02_08200 [Pseudomonadota bacterium]
MTTVTFPDCSGSQSLRQEGLWTRLDSALRRFLRQRQEAAQARRSLHMMSNADRRDIGLPEEPEDAQRKLQNYRDRHLRY